MKFNYLIAISLSLLLFCSCNSESKKLKAEIAALKLENSNLMLDEKITSGEYAGLIQDMNAIEDSLKSISSRDKQIQELLQSDEFKAEGDQRTQIMKQIEALRDANIKAKNDAKNLQSRLRRYQVENADLRKMIQNVEGRLIKKEAELEDAQNLIEELNIALKQTRNDLSATQGELVITNEELKRKK